MLDSRRVVKNRKIQPEAVFCPTKNQGLEWMNSNPRMQIAQIFTALTNYFVLIRPILGASAKAYLTSQWLPLRMALPTLCISYALGYGLEELLTVALTLTIQIAAGGLVWVLMLLRSQDPLILELKQIVLRKTSTARTLKNNEKLI
ncbi:hypothetical protein [Pantoea sp. FN0305]|uniref:hypothetical protein n=1 Tax=Pantoea sp. FN0305 TaxID=3418559 RepID=UPI003CEEC5A3